MSRSRRDEQSKPSPVAGNSEEVGIEQVSHPCYEHVRELAYFKWQQAGCPDCDGVEFWLAAETEIREPAEASGEVAGD